MLLQDIPTDTELEAIAETMLPSVYERIEHRRRASKRRRLTAFTVGGAALLVSGTLLGAAVVAPVFNPGGGRLYENGNLIPASFAVNCYTSNGSDSPGLTQQYSSQNDVNKAVSDLGAACESLEFRAATTSAVGAEAQQQHSAGFDCGRITVNGAHTAWWSFGSSGGTPAAITVSSGPTSGSDDRSGSGFGCGPTVALTVPRTSIGQYAACAIASNWVAVYPLDGQDASNVCHRHGYQLWSA